MELSHYIYNTNNQLYHSVLDRYLPNDENILHNNFALKGQEYDALTTRLFSTPTVLQLVIIPTWECNLRCSHCSVIHRLKKIDNNEIDISGLLRFISSYCDRYKITSISATLLGGEALLRVDKCNEIIDGIITISALHGFKCNLDLTTNLAISMTADIMRLLSKLDAFTVSLDGVESQHNQQRRSNKLDNPYKATLENLRILVDAGMRKRIRIQAALNGPLDVEARKDYFRQLLRIGILPHNIVYGCVHPTNNNPVPSASFIKSIQSTKLRRRPCCEFRYMSYFLVDGRNELHTNYFNDAEPLGSYDTDFGIIEGKYKQRILETMPLLQDPQCLSCPVIGFCWGGCINKQVMGKPSLCCGKKNIQITVNNMALHGTLCAIR